MTAALNRFVVGLTGGIGSGKSSAAAHFAQLGAFVIDADAQSHALTQAHGPAIPAIAAAFPGVVSDGELNRVALRTRVFDQPAERAKLEAILHPMIRVASQQALATPEAATAPYVMHMVPLLFESKGYADRISCAVVVDVDEAIQIDRVTRIRGVPLATVKQIINSQMSRANKLLRAQFVIDNSGPESMLAAQVGNLHRVFLANAALAKLPRVTVL
ncbi:MAG: dephospho-CoA kinase [Rhizobacter sp.]|nr:dephospho-CoA kinase [Burkholderiales bacterium]